MQYRILSVGGPLAAAVFCFAAVSLLEASAHATCISYEAEASIIDPAGGDECAPLAKGATLANRSALEVYGTYRLCCHPPGGAAGDCRQEVIRPFDVRLKTADGDTVEGKFEKADKTCSELPVIRFEETLSGGDYVLRVGRSSYEISVAAAGTNASADTAEKTVDAELKQQADQQDSEQAPAAEPKASSAGCASCRGSSGNSASASLFLLALALWLPRKFRR